MIITKKYKFQNKSPISINDKDINKIVVSNKLPFSKQYFTYFNCYKDDKTLDLYAHSVVGVYRIDFDETECMYFMIKQENVLDKFMEIWEKLAI